MLFKQFGQFIPSRRNPSGFTRYYNKAIILKIYPHLFQSLSFYLSLILFAGFAFVGLSVKAQNEVISAEELPDNITAPPELWRAIGQTLAYFPELKYTTIQFKYADNMGHTVMQAQPAIQPFNCKENRGYVVRMRREYKQHSELLAIHELPEAVLMGWLGHELGHIMDYLDRSNFAMLGFGSGYLISEKLMRRAEDRADTYAVKHGLGEYLITTRKFILRSTGMPEQYVQKISRFYHSPEALELLMADED